MVRTNYFAVVVAAILTVFATGCIVSFEPERATNPVGTQHTVSVELRDFDEAEQVAVCEAVIEILEDILGGGEEAPEEFCEEFIVLPRVTDHSLVNFEIVDGPNTGLNSDEDGTCLPSCNDLDVREVSWTYASNGQAGTDLIEVCVDFFDYIIPSVLTEFQGEVGTTQTQDQLEERLLDALNEVLGTDYESEEDIFCETATKTWVAETRPNIGAGLSGLFAGQPTALPIAPAPAAVAPTQTTIRPPSTGDAGLK